MPIPSNVAELTGRCDRLAALLESDPQNLSLLSGLAEAALAAGRPQLARTTLERYAKLARLPEREAGMAALAAMQAGDFEGASVQFRTLLDRHPDDPALRFNLAWSLAMLKDFQGALGLLDAATADALPQAAALKLQLLHDQGLFDDAFAQGNQFLERHAGNQMILASMSTLALDVEDADLAKKCAEQAGDHPEAHTTLGILALGEQDHAAAKRHFDEALARTPDAPRTLLGKGLVDLAAGNPAVAANEMKRGAKLFETHIGSWIAAGWAHLLANNVPASRRCFETAYNLDDAFAESHGSLAVIDLVEGRIDEAKRRVDVALRLDRESVSAAFAKACIAATAGRAELAQSILQRVFTTPIGRNGYRIADALARLSFTH
jgi:tetratricopeptide (TPR) repeat protein